jgi:hypothetical protein
MAMTKEQLLEQMEMDQMIAQAEMAGDPFIQDDRVQLSAPPRGTGDDMYRDMGAIDPSQMNTGAGDMGGIEPETLSNALSNEELIMAEEFMNALPKEAHESFIDRLINDPKATIMSIMDTLGDAFGGGSGQIMDDLRDRGALSGINSGLIKGATREGEMATREGEMFGSTPSVLRSKGVGEKDIYEYLKMLDPASPVREGEMSRSVVREGE